MRAFHFQKKQFWTPWICCRNYKPWFTTQTFKLALEAGERGERESSSKTVMLYYSHGRGEFWTQRRVFPRCRKEQKNQPWGNLSRETKKSFKNMEVGELALWDTSGRFGGGGGGCRVPKQLMEASSAAQCFQQKQLRNVCCRKGNMNLVYQVTTGIFEPWFSKGGRILGESQDPSSSTVL